ncbi:Cortactin-binding protein 2 (CortBP2) [Durusdinium trenchii]|uniref:Cortactin-binding protein 2 (CortBP2) n=1 Tax=Durusdinium trenchii TaxID=1381693 RepID=A0ABP0HZF3_9DINO
MPKGDGLGFVSKDYADLFRELRGDLANKEPSSLKPPYRVASAKWPSSTRSPSPVGVLRMKIRMPGDRFPIDAVVQGEYMKWSIVEALMQSFKKLLKIQINTGSILMCTDEIKILEVHTPSMAGNLWQFCEFRFDYQVAVEEEAALALVSGVFNRMADFEASFCQSLENKFREIYHLTVLGLINKRFALMDGRAVWNQLQFFKAAEVNDTNEITRLLKEVDVNAVQKEIRFPQGVLDEDSYFSVVTLQRTPLLAAAEAGRLEAVQLLVRAKAEVNYQDTSGFHALYLAAGSGVPEVVSCLLLQNADLHLRNRSGYTALHNAVGCGQAECIKVLLQANGDLNLKTRSGVAPVHLAAISNQSASLEVLKQCRANLDMPAVGGNTPVHEGVMQNNPEIIQKLFDLKEEEEGCKEAAGAQRFGEGTRRQPSGQLGDCGVQAPPPQLALKPE